MSKVEARPYTFPVVAMPREDHMEKVTDEINQVLSTGRYVGHLVVMHPHGEEQLGVVLFVENPADNHIDD